MKKISLYLASAALVFGMFDADAFVFGRMGHLDKKDALLYSDFKKEADKEDAAKELTDMKKKISDVKANLIKVSQKIFEGLKDKGLSEEELVYEMLNWPSDKDKSIASESRWYASLNTFPTDQSTSRGTLVSWEDNLLDAAARIENAISALSKSKIISEKVLRECVKAVLEDSEKINKKTQEILTSLNTSMKEKKTEDLDSIITDLDTISNKGNDIQDILDKYNIKLKSDNISNADEKILDTVRQAFYDQIEKAFPPEIKVKGAMVQLNDKAILVATKNVLISSETAKLLLDEHVRILLNYLRDKIKQHIDTLKKEKEDLQGEKTANTEKINKLRDAFINDISIIILRLKALRPNLLAKDIMRGNMQILNSIVQFATVIYNEKNGRKTNVYIPIYSSLTDIVTKGENAIPNPATADWENDKTWD